MWEHDIGFSPSSRAEKRAFAVITDRDGFLAVYFQARNLAHLVVAQRDVHRRSPPGPREAESKKPNN